MMPTEFHQKINDTVTVTLSASVTVTQTACLRKTAKRGEKIENRDDC